MEEVSANSYGHDRQYTKRFLASEEERQEMPLYQKVGLGAVAAAGLLAAGHRTGAMRKIANFLDNEARLTLQATREIINEEGSLYKDFTLERIGNFTSKVKGRQQELMTARRKADIDFLESRGPGREFAMERMLRQRKNLIETEMPGKIQDGLRFQAFMDEIRQNQNVSGEHADMIETALGKSESGAGILRHSTTTNDIKYHLKNGGIDDRDTLQLVEQVRRNVNQRDFSVRSEEGRKWIEGMQKKVRKLTADQMQQQNKKNGVIRNSLIGHKQATVGDILKLHDDGQLNINADLKAQINDVLSNNKNFKEAVFDENLYVKTKNGEVSGLMDYQVYSDMNRKSMEWWSHTLPGGLMHLRDILNIKQAKEQASFRIFKRQTVQPMLNAHRGFDNKQPLSDEVIFAAGKFVKLFDHEAVNSDAALKILNPKRDMYLTSARYGTIPEVAKSVADLRTEDKTRNFVFSKLDLMNQGKESSGSQAYGVFSKFMNPDWQRNQINNALMQGIETPEQYYDIQRYFKRNTQGFTPRTMNHLATMLPEQVQGEIAEMGINFSRQEDMLKLFKHLGQDRNVSYEYRKLFNQFERNPDEVLGKTLPIGETNPIIGGTVRVQTGFSQIEQQIGMEFIRQISNVNSAQFRTAAPEVIQNQLRNRINSLHDEGKILRNDRQQAEWLINQYMFESAGRGIHGTSEAAISQVNHLFRGQEESARVFQKSVKNMVKETNPIWETFKETVPINQIEDEYIAVNKANIFENLKSVDGFKDLLTQLGMRTGRRNMEDFTTLSIYGSYYPGYRLQDALGNVGLGFSDDSMGSPLQLWSSLMLKRIAPIFGSVGAFQYADYEVDKYTGAGITDRWETYKANRRMEDAYAREDMGSIDHIKRQQMLRPGIEHFEAMPSIHIPMIGEVGPGDFFNTLTSVLSGNSIESYSSKDAMTAEETYEDLTEGEEEIRKGRWWAFGSKTAYRGDRIKEFAPNDYRKAISDWEYTNVTGTGEEKYGNSFFPTFENPFGALGYLMGTADPYWFEKKHYYDRPYMLTGELFNSNTPFMGDIGNATIGALLKPVRQMHTEYWGDPVLMQESTEQHGQRPDNPVTTRISPSGRVEYEVAATPDEYGGAPYLNESYAAAPSMQAYIENAKAPHQGNYPKQYLMVPQYDSETLEPTGDVVIHDTVTRDTMYLPARMQGEYKNVDHAFKAARELNEKQIETSPRGLFAPAHVYQENVDKRKLMELNDPRSIEWRTQELASNWLEPHGVYNWIVMDEIFGRDPYSGQMVMSRADQAYNKSNAFWESELGSLGASLSEIGRRFIRKDSGFLDTYNPIKNTMPDWLPGGDYFQNFQVGDAYSMIPHGEYRLPGEAYESLNELHPDETGSYGAFDKLKILADVAPWSDEYKFWRDYTTKYLEDEELRKQAAEIKRQASKRKQKYEFQEYIYKNAELEKMDVTVTRFLDDYTFLTEEFGDQPIRLAGVDVKPRAEGVLQQYVDEGDKITIGVDVDPTQRINNDTYSTMKAVVFRGIESLNRHIIERGEMKESQTDLSPTGVWARFSPSEIASGARWESIAHHESALNTKFLQVRTALEEYERDQIYGKDWATWENFGISDYLVPSVQRMAGRDTLGALASGTLVGGFIGRIFLGGGKNTKYGAVLGGVTGLTANLFGKHHEYSTGEKWIPERRRTEQDINEYFDILKYMKFSGLYEKAKEELNHMGYNAEQFLAEVEAKEEHTKERRKALNEEKKQLFINQPNGWEDRKKEINTELNAISEEWDTMQLPAPVAQALYFKEEAEGTLYAIDPHEDRMKVMKALPYKDKWFFNEFADARLEDREKILELVPENQRRIYRAIWGEELEEQKPLEYYAEKYNIPDVSWEGWRPEFSLEDIKVKVVQEEGLDLSDFNYWGDDIEASTYTPDVPNQQYEAQAEFLGYKNLEQNIRSIMQGEGLWDVQVTVSPSNGTETDVSVSYEEDRSQEISDHLKYNMESYM
jgi:hypothetical protein